VASSHPCGRHFSVPGRQYDADDTKLIHNNNFV
jgi:hypothetical protein